ncbi:hypothetical protein [Shimazuella alba]|uniref:Uncharacterized protein n=1 Tax=Shimazuella alba TaxID=2690964 RepID=A0A6I4VZS3_9BACL|nr:hypothetical protein [Shimazuella alba]MXQ55236.1 hypothetical protein [Shimazuella alba]
MTQKLMSEAKKRKVKVSFDINYRAKMWSSHKAREVLSTLLPYVDYCSAGKLYEQMKERYPNITLFYSTIRQVESASHHTLVGRSPLLFKEACPELNPIVDRVGGVDAAA